MPKPFSETFNEVREKISSCAGARPSEIARELRTDRRRVALALRLLKAVRLGFISSCVLQELLKNGASQRMLEAEVRFAEEYHKGVS